MTKRKPFDQLTLKQKITVYYIPILFAIYLPISEIWSTFLLADAYHAFDHGARDMIYMNANWASNPIVDLLMVESGSCPTGYTGLNRIADSNTQNSRTNMQGASTWPGAKAMCKCGNTGDAVTSCKPNFNPSTEAGSSGCKHSFSLKSKSKSYTYETSVGYPCDQKHPPTTVCGNETSKCNAASDAKKAGCTTIKATGSVLMQKLPYGDANTHDVQFTAANDNQGRAYNLWTAAAGSANLCVKRAPYTYADVLNFNASSGTCPGGLKRCGAVCVPADSGNCPMSSLEYSENTYKFAEQQSSNSTALGAGKEPIVDIQIVPGLPCYADPVKHEGFSVMTTQLAKNTGETSDTNPSRGNCKSTKIDTRWKVAGKINQLDLYSANGIGKINEASVDRSKPLEVAAWDSLNANELNLAYNSLPSNFANPTQWSVVYRHGITWKLDCEKTKKDMVEFTDEIKKISTTVEWSFYIQIFFGCVCLAVLFPLVLVCQLCEKDQDLSFCPGEGLEEKRNINIGKGITSFVSICLKFGFIYSSYHSVNSTNKVLKLVTDCAVDSISRDTVSEVQPVVQSMSEDNNKALIMLCISLAGIVAGWAWAGYNGCKIPEDLIDTSEDTEAPEDTSN